MKITTLFLSALFLFALGCHNVPTNDDTDKPGDSLDTNPDSYLLVRQVWEHPSGTNGQSFHYSYNQDNLVSKIVRVQWGYGSTNGAPPEKWIDSSSQFFEYDGTIPVRCRHWSEHYGIPGQTGREQTKTEL